VVLKRGVQICCVCLKGAKANLRVELLKAASWWDLAAWLIFREEK